MERITSEMTLEEETNRNDDTRIQQAIVHPMDMILNQHTHRSTVLTERASTTRGQQLITKWVVSQLIVTLPPDGVGR